MKLGGANEIGRTVEPRRSLGLMETRELWHPDSPGTRVRVRVFAFSPRGSFATAGQVLRAYKSGSKHKQGVFLTRPRAEVATKWTGTEKAFLDGRASNREAGLQ
jgi:hypothetical protein